LGNEFTEARGLFLKYTTCYLLVGNKFVEKRGLSLRYDIFYQLVGHESFARVVAN